MYLKKIILKNYKSYNNLEINFDKGLTVIVGENGSGKSNLLEAIQCIMNPDLYILHHNDKYKYVNDETEVDISASIEIILDNTDKRIPINKIEISLKRVLSNKKDLYFIDSKNVKKIDMLNLLESIGFSRSNSFNFIRQGKINELAISSDDERLKLILEMAGVNLYIEKRQESLKILNECQDKSLKIQTKLQEINDNIKQLEVEKRDLIEFNTREKQKNCIEYLILTKESQECVQQLNQINQQKDLLKEEVLQLTIEIDSITKSIEIKKDEIKDNQEEKLRNEVEEIKNTIDRNLLKKSSIEIELDQIKRNDIQSIELKENYQNELKVLKKEAVIKEKELNQIKLELKNTLNIKKYIMEQLNDTKSCEVDSLNNGGNKDIFVDKLNEIKQKINELENNIETYKVKISQIKNERNILIQNKKNLWTKEWEFNKKKDELNEKLKIYDKKLCHIISRDIYKGIKSLEDIVSKYQINGVYGTLIDNINCDTRFFTAIDVVAGYKLFNIIVETSKIATDILKYFKSDNLPGCITLMALDKLIPREYPSINIDGCIPLYKKLKFDTKFNKVIRTIFGNTFLCRDNDAMISICKAGYDGVTLDGDQMFKKGNIIGGYTTPTNSIPSIMNDIKLTKEELKSIENNTKEIVSQIEELKEQINNINISIENDENKLNLLLIELNKYNCQKCDITTDLDRMDKISSSKENDSFDNISDFVNLSEQELESKYDEISVNIKTLSTQYDTINSLLESNYYSLIKNLTSKILSFTGPLQSYETKKTELTLISDQINEDYKRINLIYEEIEKVKEKTIINSNEVDELILRNSTLINKKTELLCKLENFTNQISHLKIKLKDNENKCIELSDINENILDKYKNYSLKSLYLEMNKPSTKETKLNKNAVEQYLELVGEYEELDKSYTSLQNSLTSIHELITSLDQRRNETIIFTLKQVDYHFQKIIPHLLIGASASLVLKRNSQSESSEDIDTYKGVSVRITLPEHENYVDVGQLSGGQKTLVALALIFALQNTDLVPIYLLDESDQALDPLHREKYAGIHLIFTKELLHQLSNKAQVIATTFRPELLNYKPNAIIVQYEGRFSHATQVTYEQALLHIQKDN